MRITVSLHRKRDLLDDSASNNHVHQEKTVISYDHLFLDLQLDKAPGYTKNYKSKRLRAGDLCPICFIERLAYDGQINLSCPKCGVISGGCFT